MTRTGHRATSLSEVHYIAGPQKPTLPDLLGRREASEARGLAEMDTICERVSRVSRKDGVLACLHLAETLVWMQAVGQRKAIFRLPRHAVHCTFGRRLPPQLLTLQNSAPLARVNRRRSAGTAVLQANSFRAALAARRTACCLLAVGRF